MRNMIGRSNVMKLRRVESGGRSLWCSTRSDVPHPARPEPRTEDTRPDEVFKQARCLGTGAACCTILGLVARFGEPHLNLKSVRWWTCRWYPPHPPRGDHSPVP